MIEICGEKKRITWGWRYTSVWDCCKRNTFGATCFYTCHCYWWLFSKNIFTTKQLVIWNPLPLSAVCLFVSSLTVIKTFCVWQKRINCRDQISIKCFAGLPLVGLPFCTFYGLKWVLSVVVVLICQCAY